MRSVLKNLSLLTALLVIVYLVANYAGDAKNRIFAMFDIPGSSVKGASTERAQEISEKFKSDIGMQLGVLQEQALNFTLGDAITVVSRLQRVPEDFHSIQEYTTNQIENFTQKK
jgi:hypothetical protein